MYLHLSTNKIFLFLFLFQQLSYRSSWAACLFQQLGYRSSWQLVYFSSLATCLFQQLGSLSDLISFAKIQFMHKFIQKFLPASFNDTWYYNSVRNIGENEIQLRNHLQINLQHSNLARLDIFPWYNFPKLWHKFPDEQIKIIRKIPEFDRKLKHYFINDLSSTVDCSRLLPVLNNRFFSSPHQFSSCVRASVKMVVPGPLRSLPRFFFHMSVYISGSVFAPFLLKFADSRKSRNS